MEMVTEPLVELALGFFRSLKMYSPPAMRIIWGTLSSLRRTTACPAVLIKK